MSRTYGNSPLKKSFFSFLTSKVTNQLIVLNLICYVVSIIAFLVYGQEKVIALFALTPSLILSGQNLWTLVTSIFLHGMFFHIFANMFSLFFIGNFLENLIGKKRFFWVYIISGIVGGLFFVFSAYIFGNVNLPAVGASGAIFGLLGVLAVLVPYSKIYLIAGPFVLIILSVVLEGILPESFIPLFSLIINILIFMMIFSLLSFNSSFRRISLPVELPMWFLPIVAIVPLAIIGFFVDLPIGNSAHFGGLVVGLVYGFYLRRNLRRKFPNKIMRLQKYFR